MATSAGETTSTSRFHRQLALETVPECPGRYRVEVSDAWNCPIVPHGGVMAALAARAMQLELGTPEHRLRTMTTVFVGQVVPGPVEVDVTVLRRGRSMSQVSATLRNVGADAGHTTTAVFGAPRPGFSFTDPQPPDAPPPEQCLSWRDERPDDMLHFNFWDHAQYRLHQGHVPWEDFPPGPASERVAWVRFDEPPVVDGVLDPLAVAALTDTMPGSISERVGSGAPLWMPPSTDLTVHLFGDARGEWLLARNRARWAGEGYASVEIELWDADRTLVGYGTQVAFLVFPEGPPPA
jgi:acyl-CoA thioesterase